jgi:hypothetical protein
MQRGPPFSPSRRPLWATHRVGWQPPPEMSPDPVEIAGKGSTARSNVAVRICCLHKFCPQLQTRNNWLTTEKRKRQARLLVCHESYAKTCRAQSHCESFCGTLIFNRSHRNSFNVPCWTHNTRRTSQEVSMKREDEYRQLANHVLRRAVKSKTHNSELNGRSWALGIWNLPPNRRISTKTETDEFNTLSSQTQTKRAAIAGTADSPVAHRLPARLGEGGTPIAILECMAMPSSSGKDRLRVHQANERQGRHYAVQFWLRTINN